MSTADASFKLDDSGFSISSGMGAGLLAVTLILLVIDEHEGTEP